MRRRDAREFVGRCSLSIPHPHPCIPTLDLGQTVRVLEWISTSLPRTGTVCNVLWPARKQLRHILDAQKSGRPKDGHDHTRQATQTLGIDTRLQSFLLCLVSVLRLSRIGRKKERKKKNMIVSKYSVVAELELGLGCKLVDNARRVRPLWLGSPHCVVVSDTALHPWDFP